MRSKHNGAVTRSREFSSDDLDVPRSDIVAFPKTVQRGVKRGVVSCLFNEVVEGHGHAFRDVDEWNELVGILAVVSVRKRDSGAVFLNGNASERWGLNPFGVNHHHASLPVDSVLVDVRQVAHVVVVDHDR